MKYVPIFIPIQDPKPTKSRLQACCRFRAPAIIAAVTALALSGCAEYRGMAKMAADESRDTIFRISCGITLGSFVRLPIPVQLPVMAQARAVCP